MQHSPPWRAALGGIVVFVLSFFALADPNWRITDVQWRQAIEDRTELERRLNLEP